MTKYDINRSAFNKIHEFDISPRRKHRNPDQINLICVEMGMKGMSKFGSNTLKNFLGFYIKSVNDFL